MTDQAQEASFDCTSEASLLVGMLCAADGGRLLEVELGAMPSGDPTFTILGSGTTSLHPMITCRHTELVVSVHAQAEWSCACMWSLRGARVRTAFQSPHTAPPLRMIRMHTEIASSSLCPTCVAGCARPLSFKLQSDHLLV
eukprot:6201817-Pleurochrysis_carterae.AAC.1